MRKLLAIFLAVALTLSFAACAAAENGEASSGGEQQTEVKDSLELLNSVWALYQEEDKFSAVGGDMSEENMKTDAPGVFGLEDTAALDATLGFPAASAGQIDGAASLMHMMNANTFTCGAYHVKSGDQTGELAKEVQENILKRQWMCGFPDKLVIATVGDYIVSCFGEESVIDTFQSKLKEAYPSAEIVCDEPIL